MSTFSSSPTDSGMYAAEYAKWQQMKKRELVEYARVILHKGLSYDASKNAMVSLISYWYKKLHGIVIEVPQDMQPLQTKEKETPAQPEQRPWIDRVEFLAAVEEWAARVNVKRPLVEWEPMKNKWATMRTSHYPVMTVDPTVLTLPRDLGEYVIVHELVHQIVPSHNRMFQLYLSCYIPEWRQVEERLQQRSVC